MKQITIYSIIFVSCCYISISAQEFTFFDGTDVETKILMQNAEAQIEIVRKGDFVLELVDENGNSIHANAVIELQSHEFDFGANLFNFHSIADNDPAKQMSLKAIDTLFNTVIVCDYWRQNQWQLNGNLHWHQPDYGMALAEKMGKRSRYHALLFGFPRWFDGLTEEQLWGIIEERIKNVADRYGDKIKEVDVINEFINYQYWTGDSPEYLRSTNFPDFAKPENGARVLNLARKYYPKAKLVVLEANFFNVPNPVFQEIYQYHKSLIEMDVDYDYIGYQAHYYAQQGVPFQEGTKKFGPRTFMMDEINKGMEQLAQLGKPIVITEFNAPSRNNTITNPNQPGLTDEEIAAWETNFYTLMFSKSYIAGISRWFTVDNLGGKGMDAGVVTEDGKLKPNYFALKKLIKEKWHTKWEGEVRDGRVDFNGFYGTYLVKVDGFKEVEVEFIKSMLSEPGNQVTVTVKISTGINNISASTENEISVYPNPVSGVAYLKNDFDGHLQILTTEGRLVYNSYHLKGDSLNLAAIKTGIYILKLTDNSKNNLTTVFSKH